MSFALLATMAFAMNAQQPQGKIEVTYLANEGLLIESGGKKILVDALFREDIGFAPPPAETLAKLESGQALFDGVSLVLATHFHEDHFNAPSVAEHLRANKRATFVSVQNVVELLFAVLPEGAPERARVRSVTPEMNQRTRFAVDGIQVDAIRLKHGDWVNTAFLIHIGGKKILHLGDTGGLVANLDAVDLEKERIDVAFVPYAYFFTEEGVRVLREHIAAKELVAFHIPDDSVMTKEYAEDSFGRVMASNMKRAGGQAGVRARVLAAWPEAKVATQPGERWLF